MTADSLPTPPSVAFCLSEPLGKRNSKGGPCNFGIYISVPNFISIPLPYPVYRTLLHLHLNDVILQAIICSIVSGLINHSDLALYSKHFLTPRSTRCSFPWCNASHPVTLSFI